MSLKQQLTEDMKQALKAGDKEKLSIIRLVLADLKNYEIDHGEQDDQGVVKIISHLVKQFKESLTDFEKAQRQDLIDETKTKLEVLKKYLPKQLSEPELRSIIKEVIGKQSQPQPGPVIGQVMQRVAGRADGSRVAKLVHEELN